MNKATRKQNTKLFSYPVTMLNGIVSGQCGTVVIVLVQFEGFGLRLRGHNVVTLRNLDK